MSRIWIPLALPLLGVLAFLGVREALEKWVPGDASEAPLHLSLSGWPRALSWEDFQNLKFPPVGQPQYAAAIRSGFGLPPGSSLSPTQQGGRWRFEQGVIAVHMANTHSWVAEEHRSDRVLEHEQMHFDITGLAAREWLEELRAVDAQSRTEALRAGGKSFDRVQKKLSLVQRLFDHADRGRREAHDEWKERLDRLRRSGGPLPEPGELPGFSGLGGE